MYIHEIPYQIIKAARPNNISSTPFPTIPFTIAGTVDGDALACGLPVAKGARACRVSAGGRRAEAEAQLLSLAAA
jgi:hypothetical protein